MLWFSCRMYKIRHCGDLSMLCIYMQCDKFMWNCESFCKLIFSMIIWVTVTLISPSLSLSPSLPLSLSLSLIVVWVWQEPITRNSLPRTCASQLLSLCPGPVWPAGTACRDRENLLRGLCGKRQSKHSVTNRCHYTTQQDLWYAGVLHIELREHAKNVLYNGIIVLDAWLVNKKTRW